MSKWTAASDVDYRNEVCGLSLAEEKIRLEREEEALREQRWAEFVAEWRRYTERVHWTHGDLLVNVGHTMARGAVTTFERLVAEFAESEGWPNVLRAIARAMDEEEQYRKELVDRR